MSEELEKLFQKIDNTVGRRGFLGKLAAASAALVTSVLGFAANTEGLVSAVGAACCAGRTPALAAAAPVPGRGTAAATSR